MASLKDFAPGGVRADRGRQGACVGEHSANIPQSRPQRQPQFLIHESGQSPRQVNLSGRPAWLLAKLIEAGPVGLTASDLPAGLRVSAFVLKLRRAGVPVLTLSEPNSGDFGGHHGRYVLACPVERIDA